MYILSGSERAYLYLSSLCERTQSRFEIRDRASSSREVVCRERLASSGPRDRRFAYALPAGGSPPKDACTRDPVSSRLVRNNSSTSALAKSIRHRARCSTAIFFSSYFRRKGRWNIFSVLNLRELISVFNTNACERRYVLSSNNTFF